MTRFELRPARFLCLAAGATALFAPTLVTAQTVATPGGLYLEAEGQAVFGDSDFTAGVIPSSLISTDFQKATLDEGDGWGGAAALGYAWGNGWSVAVRYRRLEADDSGGPVDPGIVAFAPGVTVIPGGLPIGVLGARTDVESETSTLDVEVGKDFYAGGARLQLFGGVTYARTDRDISISGGCGCIPIAVLMSSDFDGIGPKIGVRGGMPLGGELSLVGGASVAALFGSSTFESSISTPGFPSYAFKDENDRTVAALDAEAGIAIAIGPGALTLGYRVNALFGALDSDQRVSALVAGIGFPEIGNTHDDFVEHGPFARFTVPLEAASN